MKKIVAKMTAVSLFVVTIGSIVIPQAQTVDAKTPVMKKKIEITKGKSKTLKVTGKYIKSCRFKTTDSRVVRVNQKGKVTAKKVGKCKIKAWIKYRANKRSRKILKKTLVCAVTVKAVSPIQTEEPSDFVASDSFVGQNAEFSVNLAKHAMGNAIEKGENALISPESVICALALVADGTEGETGKQLEKILMGDMDLTAFREQLSEYNKYLTASEDVKFHLANSIWIRDTDELTVKEDYLQKMKHYYDALVCRSGFDSQTVQEINNWVKENTQGMIPSLIDEIPVEAMMFLINALSFEGRWQRQYQDNQIKSGESFTSASGIKETATMLQSSEYEYVEDQRSTGVIKNYEGGKYAFMGILPKKGISLKEYMDSMTGESILKLYQTRSYQEVLTKIPEFSYDYSIGLAESFKKMGVEDLFDREKADLTGLARMKNQNLYVDEILHKTHMELDRNGTKAAAVTAVIMEAASAAPVEEPKQVYLDRPFLYVIIDTNSGLPVFIGAVNTLEK